MPLKLPSFRPPDQQSDFQSITGYEWASRITDFLKTLVDYLNNLGNPTQYNLTTEDEGTVLSTNVNTLNFVGTGVTASGTGNLTTITIPGGAVSGDQYWFGPGIDGAFTYDGVTTCAWATLAGGTYTLNRNVFHTTATIGSGVTLKVNGTGVTTGIWCLVALVATDSSSTISCKGGSAAGSTGGALPTGVGAWGTGSVGGNGNLLGGGATSGVAHAFGGRGGNGGAGASGAGGTAGALTLQSEQSNGVNAPYVASNMYQGSAFPSNVMSTGTGGGGGGGNGTGTGGGGGSSGGWVVVYAKAIQGSGTFNASGGDGANIGTAANGGGGGGGGGGAIITLSRATDTWTRNVSGGNGGTGSGTGAAGANGSAGHHYEILA